MSAFNRLAGTEEPKLPVWGLICDMTRVLDSDMTFADFAAMYELSASEQAEVGEYLTVLGGMVATFTTSLGSVELARTVVNGKMMHALLRAERGTHTEASFRAVFGLS